MRLVPRPAISLLATALAVAACSDPLPKSDPGETALVTGCHAVENPPLTYNAAGRGSPCLIWATTGTTLYAVADSAYPETMYGAQGVRVKTLVRLTRSGAQWTPTVVRRIPTPALLGVSDATDAIYIATVTNEAYNTITISRVSLASVADPVVVTTANYGPILVSADDRFIVFRSPGATLAATDSIVVLDRTTGARKAFAAELSRIVAVNGDGTTVLFITRMANGMQSLNVSSGAVTEVAAAAGLVAVDAAWVGPQLHLLTRATSDSRIDVSPNPVGQSVVKAVGPIAWAPQGRAFVNYEYSTTFDQAGYAGDRTEFIGASPSFAGILASVNERASRVILSPDGAWMAYRTSYGLYIKKMP